MNEQLIRLVLLGAVLVMSTLATGAAVTMAISTEAPDNAPGLPASFYGPVHDENGTNASVGTTVVAVVNGETRGKITVEEPGYYGSSGPFGEKISVDSAAGSTVSFHLDNRSGTPAIENPVPLDDGTDEQRLTFPDDTFGDDDLTEPAPEPEPDPESPEYQMELLAETEVDHEHACLHGEYDDRVPLSAAATPEEAPTVSEDHVVWRVEHNSSEGYVTFDTNDHWYDGTFVLYTAAGSIEPVKGTVVETGQVSDDDHCKSLESYTEVRPPEDGKILLSVSGDTDADDEELPLSPEPDERPPEAAFDVEPTLPRVGEPVKLNASASAGLNTSITEFRWQIGANEAAGEQVTTTLNTSGKILIELIVEDERGATTTANETLTVLDSGPLPVSIAALNISENVTTEAEQNVTVTLKNTGKRSETVPIISRLAGDTQHEASVEIGANERLIHEFGLQVPAQPGTYRHTIELPSDNQSTMISVASPQSNSDQTRNEPQVTPKPNGTTPMTTPSVTASPDIEEQSGLGTVAVLLAFLLCVSAIGWRCSTS